MIGDRELPLAGYLVVHRVDHATAAEHDLRFELPGQLLNESLRREPTMNFFLQVAFDLVMGAKDEYDKVETGLRQIQLSRQIRSEDGAVINLPFNTFAGYIDADDAQTAFNRVRGEFELTQFWEGIVGRTFISVSPANVSYKSIVSGKSKPT